MSSAPTSTAPTVLHVVESWPPVVSGYTSRSEAVVRAQVAGGEVRPAVLVTSRQHLYTSAPPTVPDGLEGRVGVVPVSPRERAVRRARRWSVDGPALRDAVVDAASAHGADVVHAHFSSTIGSAAAAGARRAGLPLVAEVRFDLAGAMAAQSLGALPAGAVDRVEPLLRLWFERHLAGADAVVSASTSLAELLVTTVPAVRDRLTVAGNGVDTERFSPGPAPADLRARLRLEGAVVVGSTARMLRYEGLDLLVEAVARIAPAHPRLRLLLVGGGPEEQRLRALTARTGAPVIFTGQVPPESVADHLRLVDVFAVPRRAVSVTRYAAPLKLLEALAGGRAVLASPVGDVPDLLAGGRGELSPAGDVDALALALAGLVTDAPRRAALGAAARAWALKAGTWRATAATTAGVYAGLAARGPR